MKIALLELISLMPVEGGKTMGEAYAHKSTHTYTLGSGKHSTGINAVFL
jgi:hypothetical protein